MQAVSTSPFNLSMLRKHNTWYTVKDGNWSDPSVWIGNGKRKYGVPQLGDDVYVGNNVNYNNSLSGSSYDFNNIIGNLAISPNGKLTANIATNQNKLIIQGNVWCDGAIDFSSTLTPIVIELNGINNYVNNFVAGSQSTIKYTSILNQPVLSIAYNNLAISNINIKSISSDLSVSGALIIDSGSTLELGPFNSTIASTSISGLLSKSSSTGAVNFASLGISSSTGSIAFSGSPTINLSGDFIGDIRAGCNMGSGTLNVLTSQVWTLNGSGNIAQSTGTNNVVIASGCVLTIAIQSGINGGGWINNGTVTGIDATSTLNIESTYGYGNSNTAMSVGTFNYNHSGTSCIQINANMTLPFNSYYDLIINGTTTVGGNTTVSRNLTINGSLQVLSYDFACSGTINYAGSFLKSGGGTVSMGPVLTASSTGILSFTGNPTVNLSGNFTGDVRSGLNFGTQPVNVLQNINFSTWIAGNAPVNITNSFLVASGKTMTNVGLTGSSGGFVTTGTINGVDSTATFDNRSICNYQNSQQPMQTGQLYCNQAANTFTYGASGNQNITVPSDGGYYNLTVNSVTGSLTGNTVVVNALMVNGTLELATYNLTVSGATTYNGTLSKSGSGTVSFNSLASGSSSSVLALSGNPTVNMSGNVSGDGTGGMSFGTGTVNILQNLSFAIYMSGTSQPNLACSFLIASGKTFTNTGLSAGTGGFKTSGVINGADVTAIFDNRSVVKYTNATAPMLTGKLYCNQANNLFNYGTGNQDVQTPADATPGYKNLTLNGGGVKKLLGNVSVKGTYTLTGPATLNANGFSLTNP